MKQTLILLSAFMLLTVISAYAAPPNDAFASAVTITVGGGCVDGDNTGATTEGLSIPSCWTGNPNNYSHSVWYKFTATDDSITINIGDGPLSTVRLNVNALTAAYSGTWGSLVEIGCAKNGNETKLTGLTINNTYYIMIDGFSNTVGTFCISAYETPKPAATIGTCSNPRDLFVGTDCVNQYGSVFFDNQDNMIWTNTSNGTDEGVSAANYGNPSAIDGTVQGVMCSDNDVVQNAYWVRFTATEATQLFTNNGTGTLDYAIFTGTCNSLSFFDCYSISGTNSVTIGDAAEPDLTPGTSYYVMITNGSGNSSNRRYLCITSTTIDQCQYDDCSSAFPITEGTTYLLDNANCSADLSLCSGSTENNIWLSWTCPVTWTGSAFLHLYNEDCVGSHGMQLSIYSPGVGCVSNNSNCIMTINPNNNNDFSGGFTPVAGETYLIDLDGYGGCGCQFNFQIDNNVILPIELVSFTADAAGNAVSLKWVTASEESNYYFAVERSNDGEHFDEIGKVDGAGTSSSTHDYSLMDENPFPVINYYRLKQINFNGEFQYSKTVALRRPSASKHVAIYPNPATAVNQIHIAFEYPSDEERVTFEIRDEVRRLQMQSVTNVKSGFNDIIIPTQKLPPGLYNIFIGGSQHQLNGVIAITD